VFDALSQCTPEDRPNASRKWYAVAASALYPATIARILECLDGDGYPSELVGDRGNIDVDPNAAARMYLSRARALNSRAWRDALEEPNPRHGAARAAERAAALEIARGWFTRAIKLRVENPGLHILADRTYRLAP